MSLLDWNISTFTLSLKGPYLYNYRLFLFLSHFFEVVLIFHLPIIIRGLSVIITLSDTIAFSVKTLVISDTLLKAVEV